MKLNQSVDDPLLLLTDENVAVLPDGTIKSNNTAARRLILQLDLDSPKLRKWRLCWMRIVQLAQERDVWLYSQLVGFPDELPNIGRLRPPSNSRPDGISSCWFVKRQQGALPESY